MRGWALGGGGAAPRCALARLRCFANNAPLLGNVASLRSDLELRPSTSDRCVSSSGIFGSSAALLAARCGRWAAPAAAGGPCWPGGTLAEFQSGIQKRLVGFNQRFGRRRERKPMNVNHTWGTSSGCWRWRCRTDSAMKKKVTQSTTGVRKARICAARIRTPGVRGALHVLRGI